MLHGAAPDDGEVTVVGSFCSDLKWKNPVVPFVISDERF